MAREGGREAASERGWEGVTARMLRRGSGAAAVQITGATGPNAAHINGVYRPVAGEGVGGKPVYKKDGADTWIEYRPGKEQWQLKPGSSKGKDAAMMHSLGTQKEAGVVEEVTAGWNVADGNSFSKQAGVRVVRYAAAVQEELLAGLRAAEARLRAAEAGLMAAEAGLRAAEAKRKEDEARRKEEEESRKEKEARVMAAMRKEEEARAVAAKRKEEARVLRCGSSAAAVQITGATGPNAAHINGVYRPVAGEGVRGKPVYKKDGADTWIEYRPVSEYRPGKEQWQLSEQGR